TPTPQQERVLELAAQGFTNQEIGSRLFISESTVRFHVQKLKAKFAARTKTELIAKAIRTGFIAPASEAGVAKTDA
ncbi:MAG TPA: LuxR C-terminal-related transcriptional regulator, partial [Thermoleophilaceae bacterium]